MSILGVLGHRLTEPRCAVFMFYKQRTANPLTVHFHFVVVKDHEPYLQSVLREYEGWSEDCNSLPLAFDHAIVLDQQEQEIGSWRILPLIPPQITKDDVSNYHSGRRIPHCAFELQLLPGKSSEPLFHSINIIGAAQSPVSFHICYCPPVGNKLITTESATSFAPQQQFEDAGNLTDPPTVKQLVKAVASVSDWRMLGINLDLDMTELNDIHTMYHVAGPNALKIMMFDKWLKKCPAASWDDVIEALTDMGEVTAADRIKAGRPPKTDYILDPDVAKKSLEATVTIDITNIGTQGYPGVGKTSVLDLAMGKEPAPMRTSTDCVDKPSRYLMIDSATEGVRWENVTTDRMFEMVCGAMKKKIDDKSLDLAESDIPTATASHDTEHEGPSHTSNTSPSEAETARPPDVSPYSRFNELLKELPTSEISEVIFGSRWIVVNDCGGQPPFLDAAALFLRNSCLQIFPVKLNESLDNPPEFTYFDEGVPASFDVDCIPLTHKQIIETLAKSVASIQPPYTPSATKSPKGAKFTIVGTFKDKATKFEEESKESILKEMLKPYHDFQVKLDKKVILPINAIAIDDEERKESAKVLRILFQMADVNLKVTVKLRQFGFLLSILTTAEDKHKPKDVLTIDECYKLGHTLGMDELETRETIKLFHDVNLIMHFDAPNLRDIVIIDPKPAVLNKLSRLISVSFLNQKFLADRYKIVLPFEANELLQYRGRFSRDTLEKCAKFTEPITLQVFLDILEYVKIAVAINKQSEYFMPCALSYALEANVVHSSPPWVIRLRVKRGDEETYIPVPVGYLPAVVVFLLTNFSSHFSTERSQQQYRNMIKLHYKHGGCVCLIERHLQLEVSFSFCKKRSLDCATIRDHVLESIRLTEEKLHIREGAITKVDSFLCSCGEGSANHTCAYNPFSETLECMETRDPCKLKTKHSRWLSNNRSVPTETGTEHHTNTASGSQSDRQTPVKDSKDHPSATSLSTSQEQATTESLWNRPLSETHLPTIAAKIEEWRVISPFLGLSAVHNSTILGEAPHSVPTQRVAMLRRWKQLLGKRATYEKLRQAFVRCGRTDLVEIVQQLVTSSENTAAERIEKDEHQQLPVTAPVQDKMLTHMQHMWTFYAVVILLLAVIIAFAHY